MWEVFFSISKRKEKKPQRLRFFLQQFMFNLRRNLFYTLHTDINCDG
jgi:hypothetical protein